MWIGVSDIEEEGNFTWLDGIAGTSENLFWYSRENVQVEPNGGTIENCVEMRSHLSYNDLPCSFERQAVCGKLLNL